LRSQREVTRFDQRVARKCAALREHLVEDRASAEDVGRRLQRAGAARFLFEAAQPGGILCGRRDDLYGHAPALARASAPRCRHLQPARGHAR